MTKEQVKPHGVWHSHTTSYKERY